MTDTMTADSVSDPIIINPEPLIEQVFAQLFAQITSDTLILTPNKRLGRFVHQQYSHYVRAQGQQVWPSLLCQSLSTWQLALWDHVLLTTDSPKILLDSTQELLIWQKVIQQNSEQLVLFNTLATAKAASETWHTLVKWGLDPLAPHSEEPYFMQWAQAFEQHCMHAQLIDSARMQTTLYQAVAQGDLSLPKHIVLLSFDELTPQMEQFFALAREQGCSVCHVSTPLLAVDTQCTGASNKELEITYAARWAAQCIQQQPTARVGVVIPSLSQDRQQIERIFTAVFEPQYLSLEQSAHAPGFNISAGQALAHTPMVAAALVVLRCYIHNAETIIDREVCTKLLHSPYIGIFDELPQRALLDNDLRQHHMQLSIAQLHYAVRSEALDDLDQRLTASLANKPILKQSAYQWTYYFRAQLDYLNWPGERQLDTLEYQQWQLWQQVLQQFCQLDYVFPMMTMSDALYALEQLAVHTQFQPQTNDSPIQVLGIFEAAGLLFDYLWVVGMDNESWPPSPKPNTLLPVAMQKKHNMPRASAERELLLSQRLTNRFCQSARHTIFSYSTHEQDKILYPSRLIATFPEVQPRLLTHPLEYYYEQQLPYNRQHAVMEYFSDFHAAPLTDMKAIRGGTQILKDQAACPFRAFAFHRLGLKPVDELKPGLTAAQRGNLMHEALAIIWKKLQRQSDLLKLDVATLQDLVEQAITSSFHLVSLPKIGQQLKRIEQQRLLRLILQWLELEKQRAPFSVLYNERKKTIKLAKLPITIRYDRVDKTGDNELFVIDYKTGKLELRSWSGQRPDEPQIPLYCISQKHIIGAAIGQINSEALAFKGIAEDETLAPGLQHPSDLKRLDLPNHWSGIIEQWREALENLAKEFLAGYAEVKPKYNPQTCQYCPLHSLCRVKEQIDR